MTRDPIYPDYTSRERRADLVIHVAGLAAAVTGVAVLLVLSALRSDGKGMASLAVYGGGLLASIGFSAWYHLDTRPALRSTLRRLDHAAIFVLIAGTYTPFAVHALGGRRGMILLAVVWAGAFAGVALKFLAPRRFEVLSVLVYLALGWAVLAVWEFIVAAVSTTSLVFLMVGGVLYTVGVLFHLWRRLPYQNVIWHVFVLTAAALHYAAVLDTMLLS